ncbi:DUF6683 family protein [Bradyrhizobium sp. CB3481]|uniref:DUF6683 family protein n=1 Tax=Bradyrhizobium sp. CB3481 TaxID=3039158 RepID=UPI0024B21B80|nr:DUF6683 family protein [Bradyrhizobium sp. CB3481]WFU16426.1 hypothetical protein QA643_36710 [Bradyrhizobium sp. CB3481]
MRDMTRIVSTVLLVVMATCLAVCLGADAALAQWSGRATASIGRSYGNLALSQSILSGTRRLGDAAPSPGPAPVPLKPAQITAALSYAADPQHSERIRAEMIRNMSGSDAALRAELERAFADDAVLKEFDRVMSASGYSSRNVADDMAVLLQMTWETYSGSTASKAQIKGIRQQVLGIFLGTPRLRAMTNAERQDMAERIAYHVVLGTLARDEALRSGDPARVTQVRQSAAATLLAHIGIDMSQLRLTERGFFKKL